VITVKTIRKMLPSFMDAVVLGPHLFMWDGFAPSCNVMRIPYKPKRLRALVAMIKAHGAYQAMFVDHPDSNRALGYKPWSPAARRKWEDYIHRLDERLAREEEPD